MVVRVLMMSTRRGSTEVHEFDGEFFGAFAHFKVTAVIGHVFSVDFSANYKDWNATDPADLFEAPILKMESNPKAHIRKHLSQEARGCSHLVLWLECDREGENICYEDTFNPYTLPCSPNVHIMDTVNAVVIECAGFHGTEGTKNIYRARFSSITDKDILKAMDGLVLPNSNEALAVDARQEIDLKVGVAFTRCQTRYFQGKYGNLDARVISYGPCQTSTLGFCVQRHLHKTTFKPEKFWVLHPYVIHKGYELKLEWGRDKLFDFDIASMFQKLVAEDGIVEVTGN